MHIGVLGGGQLGRMLALAGYPLGLQFIFFEPAEEAPAEHLADRIVGDFDDHQKLQELTDQVDVVTYEFENVPVSAARFVAERRPVYPPAAALEVSQDRLIEKTFFERLEIPTPPFVAVDSLDHLKRAVQQIGLPAVLKTRRMGYDGKGQEILRSAADVDAAWQRLTGTPLLLEGFVAFQRELSILAVRSRNGEKAFYCLVENEHRQGILRLSRAPAADVPAALQAQAQRYATAILEQLDYVGVLAIELFEVGGRLLANEMAPRVHNSGHWSIEGAETSQFENHLRAILDLPLGPTATIGHSTMFNLIGTLPDAAAVLAVPGAHLHLYGKTTRPARKLGHVTVRADDIETLNRRVAEMRRVLGAGNE
ncbi:MAG: 5-(carboxyamino)imidazole ribonucleotide synthase [Deltaproteobacteria bacterium]|nr:5-(carboxyamino)imidazole ribonucleotide synthase [Deltaproteobacteria bacterium]